MTRREAAREEALDKTREVYRRRVRRREQADARNPDRLKQTDRTKEANYRKMFEACGLLPLARRDVLEIGCAWGSWLALCRQEWGQDAGARLCGIELMQEWAAKGRHLYEFIDLRCGSGDQVPWPDHSFDIVHQAMVFSSVLDPDLREGIAAEMRRVVRPGGYVAWYDFFFNPLNTDTVRMTLGRVTGYFPDWETVYRDRVTLAAPLTRAMQKIWSSGVDLLTRIRILNFHYLILLRKPE